MAAETLHVSHQDRPQALPLPPPATTAEANLYQAENELRRMRAELQQWLDAQRAHLGKGFETFLATWETQQEAIADAGEMERAYFELQRRLMAAVERQEQARRACVEVEELVRQTEQLRDQMAQLRDELTQFRAAMEQQVQESRDQMAQLQDHIRDQVEGQVTQLQDRLAAPPRALIFQSDWFHVGTLPQATGELSHRVERPHGLIIEGPMKPTVLVRYRTNPPEGMRPGAVFQLQANILHIAHGGWRSNWICYDEENMWVGLYMHSPASAGTGGFTIPGPGPRDNAPNIYSLTFEDLEMCFRLEPC